MKKALLSVFTLVLALIPLWMFIGFRSLLSPEGFFQEFFVFGMGIYFLGFTQIILLISWLVILTGIWGGPVRLRHRRKFTISHF